ncbi:2-C-methyl-D-erythritol 4-phosphate cytidylyltransferase [Bacillus solimangrovi]|uniref:2-C-methyl-D-erythritol 4-phosphate cytidylyltransferase n=1 Tax=Bacillus solimangrovi TaxID=1305675 RepID=A0A1E5LGG7_9BACI|nr:2-C-methyl-D-erythritol 4-phosphate cytidylyltransferase [Bacillus solimangrovi]OEH93164.1 2-C-methyl-D-erythritol 4-phosphate cytidylyltransferase [Bacillus solimangrovi]
MFYDVVIPAAGQGKRMKAGRNKQMIDLLGKPVIVHTLEVFQHDPMCRLIVIVAQAEEVDLMQKLIERYQFSKVAHIVEGGKERQHSVYSGLKVLTGEGIVLIHDGARPFIPHKIIHELVSQTEQVHAAVVAVPVKDTIKQAFNGLVQNTVERSSLWAVQTPQAFRLSLIKTAHEQAEQEGYLGTDDASLIERIGKEVAIVTGTYENIKLTTPEDLLVAKAILQDRKIREDE